jgi:putative transposase
MLDRWLEHKEEQAALIPIIYQIRNDHPKMSARKMYLKIQPQTLGRDKFEKLCFSLGLKVSLGRNFRRTTDSSGVERFPNLIEGREVTGVNRVFVSDITYYEISNRYYYLTFIMDLYSREIVGYRKSTSLRTTETTLPAIKMMIRKIGKANIKGAIFHSDGGGQYYAKDFLKLTTSLNMKNSMAKEVYDNSHAERINGIIKNDYLIPYNPQDELQLEQQLTRAIRNYNTGRPHDSLGGLTPFQFRTHHIGKPMFIKKITTTIEVENNSPSYFPTSTVNHHQQLCIIE